MSYPLYHHKVGVESRDLDLLAPLFSQTIKEICPCETVYFVGPSVSGDGLPTRWKAGVEVVRNGMQPVKDKGANPALYMPLWTEDDLFGVAVLLGGDPRVLELSAVHLFEKSKTISRELHFVKQGAIDPVTQLGNGLVLQAKLATLSITEHDADNALLLFDFYPKASDAGSVGQVIDKMGSCLQALIGHLAFPCHLGNGLFGLCWSGASEETATKMADQVLQWLKRDNLARGHAGIVACAGGAVSTLLDRAWQALGVARKRGPFGVCSYTTIVNRTVHPLYPPPGKVVHTLQNLMKGAKQFGLVELKSDYGSGLFDPQLVAKLAGTTVVPERGNAYVFLPDVTEKDTLEWCRSAQSVFAENKVSFSMGVCVYPFEKFKKGEMVANCRKALLHTKFFGPGTCTVFDGVSLNISGDVYYNEGDMIKASREYRRGLVIDSENVNLLNSMGVTMAQMAHYTKAIPFFEKVLDVDPRDFMALCNLGFSHVALGHFDQAISAFEEGLLCDETHFDLLFQLGKMYCIEGRYKDAVKVLERAAEMGQENIEDLSHGSVHHYLGEAYYYENNVRKGMASLQRAIRYNSRDALALSLLGELYAHGGEGLDIGLTFCQQAVEIDPDCPEHLLRLGKLLFGDNQLDKAQDVLQTLVLLHYQNNDVLLFQAGLYDAQGETKKAGVFYQKLLKENPKHKVAIKALKRLKKQK